MTNSQTALNFEDALSELEGIVQRLESGKITLEESVTAYERGMALRQMCETHLKNARLKIQKVTQNDNGEFTTTELNPETLS